MPMSEPVLVIGATGRQGGSVTRHLLERNRTVRALTRDLADPRAVALETRGVELVKGDMEDPASLEAAMRGVCGVYSVQDYWSVGAVAEIRQGRNVADAAAKVGIDQIVYSSVGGAERDAHIDHWDTKWQIEQHIRALGLPATILRPAAFMENYYIPAVEKALVKGRLLDPIRANKSYQTIASDDIGKFAALAFDRADAFIGKSLEIAGSDLTNPQAAEIFARVLGRPVKYRHLPLPITRIALGKEYYQMFRWFNRAGFQADIRALHRDYPEIHLTTLEEWLHQEGWKGKRAITTKRDKMGRPVPGR
jgi:uncharacterized protein YbjT (DUF2867 family)